MFRRYNGALGAAPAISGLVNGCGSAGAILQGLGTAAVVAACGWRGLFYALGGLMLLAVAALVPAIGVEAQARANAQRRAS